MKIFLIGIIITVTFISSCNDTAPTNDNSITIDIDIDKKVKFADAEMLLDTLGHSIIILDTVDNSFIGDVDNLKVSGNRMYIWDRDNKTIFIYDLNGSYLSKIKSLGRAKNEYIDIEDYYVSEDKLYILDNVTMKILIYDTIGKYIKSLDISMYWANSLFVIDNIIYLINNTSDTENGKYHVFKIDDNGKLIDSYLKFNYQLEIGSDMNVCSEINKTFNLCIPPINTIYKIDDSECQPAYNINFIDKNLPKKYYEKNLMALISEGVTDKYILGVDRMHESLNHLIFCFYHKGQSTTAIYDKINRDVKVSNGIIVSSYYRIGLGNYFICNGYIYNIVNSSVFKIVADQIIKKNTNPDDKYIQEVDEINRKIVDSYSNPLIIRYKLK